MVDGNFGLDKTMDFTKRYITDRGGLATDMKNFVIYMLVVVCVLMPVMAAAQAQSTSLGERPGTYVDNPIKKTFSLLDPQRMKISHSYSFSYLSGGGQTGTVGMYFGTIRYQISKPLTLRVGLAYTHNPLTAFGANTEGIVGQGVYPSFSLNYRPSPNLFLEIGFQRVPGYGSWLLAPWESASTGWWRTR